MIVENTVSLSRSYLESKGITLTMNLSNSLPDIYASPQQINQVLLNLVNNAIEALSGTGNKNEDRKNREIKITTMSKEHQVIISIADNGPGIAEQDIQNIFDPFYTQKKQMGVGVGLSVCHAIVGSHQGMIQVKNAPEGGAIFTVTLPVSQA